ncbi:Transport and Golgi organization protein 2 [Arabidopsis thaliana x Arabidopsis arenosa]|uniref:Transport and Golgi organization protein 2 n=1 Tax=Arabidopsis thaliana x Arabidopsis arenosa TaxID=1240361 RepID=A0A8T2C0D6_9BRAS|nr:Transport and Golgi organization protein 2 [Arabidopsis thaliana x Arabidopsis arenosa]
MGIVAFNWAEGNNNQLTLLMNRDNWVHRDISGASWNGNGQILSGRSADNDGTWFGISRGGRVAFLVSAEILLDHFDPFFASELYPIKFLEGNMTPQAFGNYVAQRGEVGQLLSFSLIVADMTLNSMIHIRKPEQAESNVMIQPVPFGVHTLSPYDGLDSIEPWVIIKYKCLVSRIVRIVHFCKSFFSLFFLFLKSNTLSFCFWWYYAGFTRV